MRYFYEKTDVGSRTLRKLIVGLLSLVMTLGTFVPLGVATSYGESQELHIQLAKTGVLQPSATSSPVQLKEGEMVHVGAEVADSSNYEVTDEDLDFGDSIPRYTDIVWTPSSDGIVVSDAAVAATHKTIKGVRAGTYYVDLTYKNSSLNIAPLKIQVNVTANNTGEVVHNPITKLLPAKFPGPVLIGETKTQEITGEDAVGGKETPQLSIVSNLPSGVVEATLNGNTLSVKGLKEGEATINIKDKDGALLIYSVNVKDPSIWQFSKETGTLNGFKNKDNPTEVVIPAEIDGVAVKTIGREAFLFNTTGDRGRVKNSITSLTLPEGLEEIRYMGFQGNDLTEIQIPDSLVTMGERSFALNKKLKKISFGANSKLSTIGEDALFFVPIESIELPKSLKVIGDSSFKGTNLKSVTIPEGVKEISSQAFALTQIERMVIPTSVEKIGYNSRNKPGSPIFFRSFKTKTGESEGQERFTCVVDHSGKATVDNTAAVVNPVPVTVKFQDMEGHTIADDIVAVGMEKNTVKKVKGTYIEKETAVEGDKHYLTNYDNPYNTPKVYTDKVIRNKIIGENYFTRGQKYEFVPVDIAGFVKPEHIEKTVTEADNTVVFKYAPAEKLQLTVEGEGVTTAPAAGKVDQGAKVKVVVREPAHKELDKLLVNGEDVKANCTFDGVQYTYSFEMNKATTVKAQYTDSAKENNLELVLEGLSDGKAKLGQALPIKVKYRGHELAANSDYLSFERSNQKGLKLDKESGTVKLMEAGNLDLTVVLKDNPEIKNTVNINVEEVPIWLRLQDEGTESVEAPVNVKIDKLYFTAGVDYYKDLEFTDPVPVLAIEKVLKAKGVNTADQNQFDCSDDGNWMKVLGGNKYWKHINPNGSFLLAVNNVMAELGVGQKKLKDGDHVLVYYDPNWHDESRMAYFTEYNVDALTDETITLHLNSVSLAEPASGVQPVANAKIGYSFNGKVVVSEKTTNNLGEVQLSFDKPGTYLVWAAKEGDPSPISTALVVVKVDKGAESALDAAKTAAINDLESYKNPQDYRETQKAELAQVVADGKAAINKAGDTDAVATALNEAKAKADEILTDEQLKALETKKDQLINQLTEYKAQDEALYETKKWNKIKKIRAEGIKNINDAETIEDAQYAYDDAIKSIDKIKTVEDELKENQRKADVVIDLINQIRDGNKTRKAFDTARTAYLKLYNPQRVLVTNKQLLDDMEREWIKENAIGYFYFSMEKSNIGQGYLIEPQKVPFAMGEPEDGKPAQPEKLGYALDRFFALNGYRAESGRSWGWYLSEIDDPNGSRTAVFPKFIQDYIDENEVNVTNPRPKERLGEFDYTSSSGWVFSNNHVHSPVGAGSVVCEDGMVIRWAFTVIGLGGDCWPTGYNAENPITTDKSEALRLLGDINSSPDKEKILSNSKVKAAYDLLKDKALDVTTDEDSLDEAISELNDAIENQSVLVAAKTAAINDLESYKNPQDYRETQKAELAQVVADGKAAINQAEDTDAVATALGVAKAKADAIKTDAQLKAEEDAAKERALAEAKTAAINDLEHYKNPAEYREAQKAELAKVVADGKVAINQAKDTDAVATALGAAKAKADAIKTDAQLKDEESKPVNPPSGGGSTGGGGVILPQPEEPSNPNAGETPVPTDLKDGWNKVGGSWYYGENGKAETGWVKADDKWYHMAEDGKMETGWIQEGDKWYYLENSGAMATGWYKDGNTWYHSDNSGKMNTGWLQDNGTWYYLGKSGAMATGWYKDGNTWYHSDNSGAMTTGWLLDNGSWYYFTNSGAMATGWYKVGNTWYYSDGSGKMATGWQNIDGRWYNFASSGAWVA